LINGKYLGILYLAIDHWNGPKNILPFIDRWKGQRNILLAIDHWKGYLNLLLIKDGQGIYYLAVDQ